MWRNITGFFSRGIWRTLAVVMLGLVVLSLATLAGLLIHASGKAVRDAIESGYPQLVNRAAAQISLFVGRPRELMTTTASILGVTGLNRWQQETVLVELALNHPQFIRVSLFDISGEEIATSGLGLLGSAAVDPGTIRSILAGEAYITGFGFVDTDTPFMTIAVPVSREGKAIGVLVARVNARELWEIVDTVRVGDTGRAFLVTGEGQVLAHYDKKHVLKQARFTERFDVTAALAGRTGFTSFKDDRHRLWISAFAPVSGVDWALVLEQSADEAYHLFRLMRRHSMWILFLTMVAAVALSMLTAGLLVRPIRRLVTRLRMVAAGDFDQHIDTGRQDEIGELVRAFDHMAEKLRGARERERSALIGDAAAWIAHELKNSLVAVKTFVQLFPERHTDSEFGRRFMRLVPGELKRWERLLKELADFSVNSTGLQCTDVDMSALVGEVVEVMRDKCMEQNVVLSLEINSPDTGMRADPERMKQVFVNLIVNALNAMPQGGTLTVRVRVFTIGRFTEAPWVQIDFVDSGKGIDPERLPLIFKPFHTEGKDGMGLGLPISRRIVEQHGGSISVDSTPGVGSTFTIRLPQKLLENACPAS